MDSLTVKAWLGVAGVAVAMGLLLFLPAGTARYWQAWLFLSVYVGAASLITLDLARHDPQLLRRRLRGGPTAEKEQTQRIIMLMASLGFISLLVVPALDHRFGWSRVPVSVVIAGGGLTLIGLSVVYRVFRVNPFASATVEVAGGQKVISAGPYAVVRHPMYAGSLIYLLGMPLALGSWWGLLSLAAMAPFLLWRLLDEERLLSRDLAGYPEYCAKVRWRLVPGVW